MLKPYIIGTAQEYSIVTSSRIAKIAMFVIILFGPVEIVFADVIQYSFTPSIGGSGINDKGQIVGTYQSNGVIEGFIDTSGEFTNIQVPGETSTFAYGINNSGQAVGDFIRTDGNSHGFLYTGGVLTTIDAPGAQQTFAVGINDTGQIVGSYFGADLISHGLLYVDGHFTTIDDPSGVRGTFIHGINDRSQIVGYFWDRQNIRHGFLDTDGHFTTLDAPCAEPLCDTLAFGINDSGEVVGLFNSNSFGSFIYTAGDFTAIDYPGAITTEVFGINDYGQIVGAFTLPDLQHGGFLGTPVIVPEPHGLPVFVGCLLCILGLVHSRTKLAERKHRASVTPGRVVDARSG